MNKTTVIVRELIQDNTRELKLRVVAGSEGLNREIKGKDVHRPGLVLTGFESIFPSDRVQLIGDLETKFLRQLSKKGLSEALLWLFNQDIPCIFVTGKNRVLPLMRELGNQKQIPVITTKTTASDVAFLITNYLSHRFSPKESIHGTMVDVYGTGLLFIGRAGIGKSEIALDLVERGHRLVADDVVDIELKPPDILIASGPEMLKHVIEIRGVGVINVREIYGIRAIRLQKRIETIVELLDWDGKEEYERLGIKEHYSKYLGIKIPLIQLPIYPGKNITVIAETIALNLHLKVYGYHAARDLNRRLLVNLKDKRRVRNYLKWDRE